jgi:hypothetical protein
MNTQAIARNMRPKLNQTKREESAMTTQDYETNELRIAIRDEERVVQSPLADRQEGLRDYVEMATQFPNELAQRVQWMLEGNYGKGQQLMCERTTTRMNRAAQFAQAIAVWEFSTTRDMARKAWRKFTDAQKKLLDGAVNAVILQWDESRKEG